MIVVENISLRAGDFAASNLSLTVPDGKYAVLMGKTGCGKTTLLEAICGLRAIDAGRVELCGVEVTRKKAAERGIGYVPQDVSLFTTMTVREHLAFALRVRRRTNGEVGARVDELASLLGIAHLLERMPNGLSGGEAQRVALGRALSHQPRVLCLDEPLSALDQDTRGEMCTLLETVNRVTGVTVLHVTHDRNEAARLADTLLELRDGRVAETQ